MTEAMPNWRNKRKKLNEFIAECYPKKNNEVA